MANCRRRSASPTAYVSVLALLNGCRLCFWRLGARTHAGDDAGTEESDVVVRTIADDVNEGGRVFNQRENFHSSIHTAAAPVKATPRCALALLQRLILSHSCMFSRVYHIVRASLVVFSAATLPALNHHLYLSRRTKGSSLRSLISATTHPLHDTNTRPYAWAMLSPLRAWPRLLRG